MGMEPPAHTDGRSLVPLIEAAARGEQLEPEGDEVQSLAYLDRTWGQQKKKPRPLVAVRRNGHRLLITTGADLPEKVELFIHDTDPTEQENVAQEHPEIAEDLRAAATQRLADQPPWETPQIELDDFYREQLRALGYVVQ